MYLRIVDKKISYPYSLATLRTETQALFSAVISDDVLAVYGVYQVAETPLPYYDHITQTPTELTPELVNGKWTQSWAVTEIYNTQAERDAAHAAVLSSMVANFEDKIDAAVATAASGPQRFTTEYLRREAQARAYVNDCDALPKGSTLPPAPVLIASFAASAQLSGYAAARLTVAQADDLYSKVDQLANLRMRKYEVKRATTTDCAQTLFDQIMAEISAVAATIT